MMIAVVYDWHGNKCEKWSVMKNTERFRASLHTHKHHFSKGFHFFGVSFSVLM